MNVNNSTRLSFVLMSRDDADLLYELDQDKDVMRYVNGGTITTRDYLNDVLLPRMDSYRNEAEGWGVMESYNHPDKSIHRLGFSSTDELL